MKNRFSKILSIIIAFAMICSMTVIAPMTVMAETVKVWEEVWSQNFDNLTQNDNGTYNLGGTNTSALEIDPATYGSDSYPNTRHAYLSTNGAGYALTLTHTASSSASMPVGVTFDGTSVYKITYDWLTNAPNESGKKSRVRLYQETRDHYQVTKSEGKPYLTTYGWGVASEAPPIGEWVQVEITYNSATNDATVKWIKADGTVILNKTGSQWSTFTDISFIELIGENGGQKIDNIVIAKEVETEVPDEPVDDGFEKVWSQNFDNLEKNADGTYNLGGTNATALEIDPETYGSDSYSNTRHAYLSTIKANDYALTLTHTASSVARIPVGVTFDGTSTYKITYDWLTNAPNIDGKKSRVKFIQSETEYHQVTKSAGKPYLTTYGWGETTEVPAIGEWVQAEITYNSATKDVTVKWIKSDGTEILNKTGLQWPNFTNIDFIELVGEEGGQMIDNIVILKEVTEEPDLPEEPEVLPENTVWSQNFDAGTANLGGVNTTALEINPAQKGNDSYPNSRHAYYSTNGAGYALSLTHTPWSEADIPVGVTVPAVSGQGVYKLTYDWKTTCGQGDGEYGAVQFKNGTDSYAVGARSLYPSSFVYNYSPNSITDYGKLTPDAWYDVEVVFDFGNQVADYTLSKDGTVVYTLEDQSISNLTSLTAIGMYGPAGGQSIDNIVLICEDGGDAPEVPDVPVDSGTEEVAFSMNFDDAKANLGGMNTTAMEINPANKGNDSYPNSRHAYYETSGSGYAFRLSHTGWSEAKIPLDASIPEKTGIGKYKVTYDWKPYCGAGDAERGLITIGGVDIGVWSKYPYIGGEKASAQLTVQKLYKVEAVYDFAAKTADVTIYDSTGATVFSKTGVACNDYITELYLLGVADGLYLDNFVIKRIYDGSETPEVKATKVVIKDKDGEIQNDWTAVSPYTSSIEIPFGAVMNQGTLTSSNIYILDKATNNTVGTVVTPGVSKATVKLNDGVSFEDGKTYIIFIKSDVAAENGTTVGKNYSFEFTVDKVRITAVAAAIRANGNEVKSFTALKAATDASIEVNYVNTAGTDVTFYVVVGYYTEANELVKHDIYKVDKDSSVYTETISLPFTVNAPSSAVRAKVMTWKSFELNKPMGKGLNIAD